MKCPYCAHLESKVVDSRPAEEGSSIRRRRECLACHKRFTTYETMESLPLVVIKKDGSRQAFDKSKLLSSMLKACEKRSVSVATLERMTDEIEQSLQNEMEREVSSAEIGELAMEKLKNVDKEAEEILSDARKRALANENRIVADAKEEASRIIERAKVEAALEKEKAADDMKREMVVLASMIAGKVVKASIDTTVQESLVNETLKEIGESTWQS